MDDMAVDPPLFASTNILQNSIATLSAGGVVLLDASTFVNASCVLHYSEIIEMILKELGWKNYFSVGESCNAMQFLRTPLTYPTSHLYRSPRDLVQSSGGIHQTMHRGR